jgi:replicative DNA helicase
MTDPIDSLPIVERAIRYAKNGFEVFPVSPVDKAPFVTNGFKDATNDLGQVQRWWKREHPNALIACRINPEYVVLDIDPRHGGDATWAALEAKYGPVTIGRQHHSGRNDGGRHIWFKRPADKLTMKPLHEWARAAGTGHKSGKNGWSAGIDMLHHNYRYTILPPSPHPETGQPYEWDDRGEPQDMPEWLSKMLILAPSPPQQLNPRPHIRPADQDSIADWYSAHTSWNDLLGPAGAGWVLVDGDGDTDGSKWRHPTATASSSCSIRHGCLFVYTPNTDFDETTDAEPNGYTRFRAWAILEHDGDLKAAARAAAELRDGPINVYPKATTYAPLDKNSKAADPTEPWPEPIPISEAEAGTLAEFPLESLPEWMQPFVVDVALDLQAKNDLPGVLGIIALSVASLGRREVVISTRWQEPLNIYCAVAMPPSSGKSPAFKKMFAPLYRYEKDQATDDAARVAHVDQKRRIIEKAMKRAEEKGDTTEAMRYLDDLMNTPAVVPFRLTIDDATPEAVVDKLAQHGERLAVLSTEGGLFDIIAGRYSDKGANLDVYLKSWSADPITVDRIGRGTTVLGRPIMTIGLTVQPAVIEAIGRNPEMVGKGLSARFMYSVPPSNVGLRDMRHELEGDTGARDLYERHLLELARRELDRENPAPIIIDRDAVDMFHNWRQEFEYKRGPGGALEVISEWTAKLESTVARVAALLALADNLDRVDVDIMRRAITIGDYWLSHMRAVLDLWGTDDVTNKARRIVDWCRQRDLSEFSVRDLYGSLRRVFPSADDTRPALMLLTERGWIRPLFDGPLILGRRGVDSPMFAIRPVSSQNCNNHVHHVDHVSRGVSEHLPSFLENSR